MAGFLTHETVTEKIFRLLYAAGCAFRGTPVLRDFEFLDSSQWWDEKTQKEWQLDRTRDLLLHARRHCPFYSEYFKKHGFDPEIGSLEELQSLPPVEKEDIKDNLDAIQNRAVKGGMIYTKTSGSSGEPLEFYRSAPWDSGHRAAILRGLGWYGVRPWMKSGLLWGIYPGLRQGMKFRITDFLQNRFRQGRFDLSDEVMLEFLRKLKGARYLEGYPSFIYELARFVNSNPSGPAGREAESIDLLLIKGTSEKIYPHYRREISKAFGTGITGEYGAAESGIVAFECPRGSYHVNSQHVVVEVEDEEIVVTNLLSHSFPFIRYRLGDAVKLKDPGFTCPCGRKGMIIEEIAGRAGGRILGLNGRDFPAMMVDYIIKDIQSKTHCVAQCQAVQRERGVMEFMVRPERGCRDKESLQKLEKIMPGLLDSYFKGHLSCRIEIVGTIPRRKGKLVEFVSEIE